ncbi:MAG: hypothetical protein LWW75_00560 [Chlorobiales bacterium]|nr:hypothetical protein [Chlorobiales bacterium]
MKMRKDTINKDDALALTFSKVPQLTLMFWFIKILATTLGETGGDAVTMSMGLGYGAGSLIFLVFFLVARLFQVFSTGYHPARYWAVVVATTTVGTTLSDYLDRSLGLGYITSSCILFFGVLAVLYLWGRMMGTIEYEEISDWRDEVFYWLTILVSNTLGTALGDFVADDLGLGFQFGALMFSGLIMLVALGYYKSGISDNILFWAAYVLTRPLGATLGDTLTKPFSHGGFALDRISSSLVILVLMIVSITIGHFAGQRSALSVSRE